MAVIIQNRMQSINHKILKIALPSSEYFPLSASDSLPLSFSLSLSLSIVTCSNTQSQFNPRIVCVGAPFLNDSRIRGIPLE